MGVMASGGVLGRGRKRMRGGLGKGLCAWLQEGRGGIGYVEVVYTCWVGKEWWGVWLGRRVYLLGEDDVHEKRRKEEEGWRRKRRQKKLEEWNGY